MTTAEENEPPRANKVTESSPIVPAAVEATKGESKLTIPEEDSRKVSLQSAQLQGVYVPPGRRRENGRPKPQEPPSWDQLSDGDVGDITHAMKTKVNVSDDYAGYAQLPSSSFNATDSLFEETGHILEAYSTIKGSSPEVFHVQVHNDNVFISIWRVHRECICSHSSAEVDMMIANTAQCTILYWLGFGLRVLLNYS